jgi:hypothetical protein
VTTFHGVCGATSYIHGGHAREPTRFRRARAWRLAGIFAAQHTAAWSRLPFDSATRGDDTLAFAFEFPVLRMIEDAGQ